MEEILRLKKVQYAIKYMNVLLHLCTYILYTDRRRDVATQGAKAKELTRWCNILLLSLHIIYPQETKESMGTYFLTT